MGRELGQLNEYVLLTVDDLVRLARCVVRDMIVQAGCCECSLQGSRSSRVAQTPRTCKPLLDEQEDDLNMRV